MEDKGENRTLLRVAEAISDGRPVDWGSEQAMNEELKTRLQYLQVLEAVATAHGAPAGTLVSEPVAGDSMESTRTAAEPVAGAAGPSLAETLDLTRWGPLMVRERLGKGGFAEVYRAFDPSLQRDVALKIRRTDYGRRDPATARYLEEARRLARVRHPNVLVVHGADEHEGRAGIWTDLVRGQTLERSLKEQGPLGAQEACLIGIDLCGALAAVHAAGLVHRDLKTSNVMREKGGRIVLMDFGSVSEQVRGDDPVVPETVSGTPLFMAPEQLAGGIATPPTDIYALGVVLYRLVTGRCPVEAATLSELREKHRKGERVPLRDHRPDLPAGFVQVVERALAAEPASRYASAGAMEQALTGALGLAVPEAAGAETRPEQGARHQWIWISLASAATIIVISLLLLLVLRSGPFSAEAVLFRLADGREERLAPGSLVRPGDRLVLEMSAPEAFYAYVLSEDENGEVFVLFPAGLDLENPLPPDVLHRLPGTQDGQQVTWEITSAGGTEHMLAIASRALQTELEKDLASLPKAETGRQVAYAPLSQRTLTVLRGIGGLAETDAPAGSTPGDVLSGIARSLASRADGRADLWTWQIQLQNPGS